MASRKNTSVKAKSSIKLTQKQLKSVARAIRQAANDRQQAAIERLLGEDFDSLAQAKRELKKNTVQVKRTAKTAIKETRGLAKAFREAFQATRSIGSPQSKTKKSTHSRKPQSGKTGQASRKQQPTQRIPPSKQRTISGPSSQTTSTEKKSTPKTGKKAITFRQLKPKKGETLLQLLDRLEALGPEAKGLLKPGERFIFTYGNGRSKRAYVDIDLAVRRMREYELSKAIFNGSYDGEETEEQLVSSIGFMKTTESFVAYEERRFMENQERKAARKRQLRESDKEIKDAIDKGELPASFMPQTFGGVVSRNEALLELARRRTEKAEKQTLKKQGVKSRRKQ